MCIARLPLSFHVHLASPRVAPRAIARRDVNALVALLVSAPPQRASPPPPPPLRASSVNLGRLRLAAYVPVGCIRGECIKVNERRVKSRKRGGSSLVLAGCYISTPVVPDCFMTALMARPSEPRFGIICLAQPVGNYVAMASGSVVLLCDFISFQSLQSAASLRLGHGAFDSFALLFQACAVQGNLMVLTWDEPTMMKRTAIK